jgi:hypothetical protein
MPDRLGERHFKSKALPTGGIILISMGRNKVERKGSGQKGKKKGCKTFCFILKY